jgi:hypothetical protein
MTWLADVTDILKADDTLTELLTGGIYDDVVEISRQLTKDAFDANKEILPCLLLKSGNEAALQNKISAVQTPLTLYFYQRAGYDVIDAALSLTVALLAQRHVGESGIWEIQFNTEIARTTDDALNCSLAVQRYNVIRLKS